MAEERCRAKEEKLEEKFESDEDTDTYYTEETDGDHVTKDFASAACLAPVQDLALTQTSGHSINPAVCSPKR